MIGIEEKKPLETANAIAARAEAWIATTTTKAGHGVHWKTDAKVPSTVIAIIAAAIQEETGTEIQNVMTAIRAREAGQFKILDAENDDLPLAIIQMVSINTMKISN